MADDSTTPRRADAANSEGRMLRALAEAADDGRVNRGVRQLASAAGLSVGGAQRALDRLEAEGAVVRTQHGEGRTQTLGLALDHPRWIAFYGADGDDWEAPVRRQPEGTVADLRAEVERLRAEVERLQGENAALRAAASPSAAMGEDVNPPPQVRGQSGTLPAAKRNTPGSYQEQPVELHHPVGGADQQQAEAEHREADEHENQLRVLAHRFQQMQPSLSEPEAMAKAEGFMERTEAQQAERAKRRARPRRGRAA